MRLCFIVEDCYRHDKMPLAVARRLAEWGHHVDVFEPRGSVTRISELAYESTHDAWVLKTVSGGPGMSVLDAVAASGLTTINDARAVRLVRDKAVAAAVARRTSLPFPITYFAAAPALLPQIPAEHYPILVKPSGGSSGRAVHLVRDRAELADLVDPLAGEGFLLAQPYVPNPGVDFKVYSIAGELYATVQRSPLHPEVTIEGHPAPLTTEVAALTAAVGDVFGLDLYGVDLLQGPDGWVVVDINDFPSFRHVPDAVLLVARCILRLAAAGSARRTRGAAVIPLRAGRETAHEGAGLGRGLPMPAAAAATGGSRGVPGPSVSRPGVSRPGVSRPGVSRRGVSTLAPVERRQAATVPVAALHQAVGRLVAALEDTGDDGGRGGSGPGPAALRVVSVRRKPGRGLTVCYRRQDRRRSGGTSRPLVTARLAEPALGDPCIDELLASAAPAEFRGCWPGIVRCPQIGLSVQAFPHDVDLPGLPAAFATSPPDGRLATALTAAAHAVLGDVGVPVTEMRVSPVRYQPGTRCVLRYHVRSATAEELVFFGKLYNDPADAAVVHGLTQRLWAALDRPLDRLRPLRRPDDPAAPSVPPVVPRPLALVEDLGLVLTEVAGGAHGGGHVTGSARLGPSRRLCSAADPPRAALAGTAAALAWMHTSRVTPERYAPSGPAYAARVSEWSQALAGAVPELAGQLGRVTRRLTETLARTEVESPVLVHGAFKPSQLVFCGTDQPVITDLDGAGLGDPALDVGYFLAYLRPPALDCDRGGTRTWYAAARDAFLGAYLAALASRGVPDLRAGLQRRASAFEAAVLLKIASRRVRRVSSPRVDEVRAAVAGIDRCLERSAGGRDG
ncbi:phosphotransferase [Actinomadura alba]|uniref:Phosphotransferase n=1 Tax=Actinomadura alba TaxID=406431 RepID=A0ABR7LWC5_9ACTN|nr:phosphotransferase [Actinomadura alba]MBC6468884.1 phosphotransferase [Actinomadura alba]